MLWSKASEVTAAPSACSLHTPILPALLLYVCCICLSSDPHLCTCEDLYSHKPIPDLNPSFQTASSFPLRQPCSPFYSAKLAWVGTLSPVFYTHQSHRRSLKYVYLWSLQTDSSLNVEAGGGSWILRCGQHRLLSHAQQISTKWRQSLIIPISLLRRIWPPQNAWCGKAFIITASTKWPRNRDLLKEYIINCIILHSGCHFIPLHRGYMGSEIWDFLPNF